MISFDLTEEQKMIVEAVSKFAVDEMREAARECDEAGQIPRALSTVQNALKTAVHCPGWSVQGYFWTSAKLW